MEFWKTSIAMPDMFAQIAAQAEEAGWDGIGMPYAPMLAPDIYICLAAAAAATTRLKVGNWVATPASHTPASAANAIKTVQMISGGRAVFALGRGDSAQAYLGMAPAPVDFFERYVRRLRNYLKNIPQPFDLDLDGGNHFPSSQTLDMAQAPEDARFGNFMADAPTVPLDMVATGPKVLGIAGRYADRITTAVGADPERIAWAMKTAEAARQEADVTHPVSYGAWFTVMVTDDIELGRAMAGGQVASQARFSAMHGKTVNLASDEDRQIFESVHDHYEMKHHFAMGSPQSKYLTDDFIDRFAIIGPADHCIERLQAIKDLGIERFSITTPFSIDNLEVGLEADARFAKEVMPALR